MPLVFSYFSNLFSSTFFNNDFFHFRLNNKVYQSKFTQDFIEGAVYKFAVALKENNGLSHAFLIPNGYTFSIAGKF